MKLFFKKLFADINKGLGIISDRGDRAVNTPFYLPQHHW